jgi:hypothetical protein
MREKLMALRNAGPTDGMILDQWMQVGADFGLAYDPREIPMEKEPGRYCVKYGGYSIDASDVSQEGWRIRNPCVDMSRLQNGAAIPFKDPDGVFISSHRPSITFPGDDRTQGSVPSADDLPNMVVAISNGAGRLVLVDLSGKVGVVVLPFGVMR